MAIIILTIIVYQSFNLILYYASGENEDYVLCSALGVYIPIFKIGGWIYRKIRLWQCRKYNTYQFFGNVSTSKLESKADRWITTKCMTAKQASQFKVVGKGEPIVEDYCLRLLNEGKDFKSVPHKSEILTDEMIKNGIEGMSKDFLEKFKRR